jgi:hypothetical protein
MCLSIRTRIGRRVLYTRKNYFFGFAYVEFMFLHTMISSSRWFTMLCPLSIGDDVESPC